MWRIHEWRLIWRLRCGKWRERLLLGNHDRVCRARGAAILVADRIADCCRALETASRYEHPVGTIENNGALRGRNTGQDHGDRITVWIRIIRQEIDSNGLAVSRRGRIIASFRRRIYRSKRDRSAQRATARIGDRHRYREDADVIDRRRTRQNVRRRIVGCPRRQRAHRERQRIAVGIGEAGVQIDRDGHVVSCRNDDVVGVERIDIRRPRRIERGRRRVGDGNGVGRRVGRTVLVLDGVRNDRVAGERSGGREHPTGTGNECYRTLRRRNRRRADNAQRIAVRIGVVGKERNDDRR